MLSFSDGRTRLKKSVERFYNRIGLELTSRQRKLLENIEKYNLIICEHQLFFPYLGIYRMPLQASYSSLNENSLIVFVCNDLLYRRSHPTTRKLGIYCRGEAQESQNKPVTIPCNRKKILSKSSIPSEKDIDIINNKIKSKYALSFDYLEKSKGFFYSAGERKVTTRRIDRITEILNQSRNYTRNYSDWCIMSNIRFYELTNSKLMGNVFFTTHSDLINSMGDILTKFREDTELFSRISNQELDLQFEDVEFKPGWRSQRNAPHRDNALNKHEMLFWLECAKCHSKNRPNIKNNRFCYKCMNCKYEQSGELDSSLFFIPDVVSKQTLTAFFHPDIRVVGARATYSKIVDRCIKEIYNLPVPPRKILGSKPNFVGLGTPFLPNGSKENQFTYKGVSDATLIMGLIEKSPQELGEGLVEKDWNMNPKLTSDFL